MHFKNPKSMKGKNALKYVKIHISHSVLDIYKIMEN